jgi:hypothetical protein
LDAQILQSKKTTQRKKKETRKNEKKEKKEKVQNRVEGKPNMVNSYQYVPERIF